MRMEKNMRSVVGLVLAISLAVSSCRDSGPEKASPDLSEAYLPEMEGLFNYLQRSHARGSYTSMADSLNLANKDLQASEIYVEAAKAYWTAGQLDSAISMLHRAVDQGMSNPRILEKLPPSDHAPEGAAWDWLIERLDSIGVRLHQPNHFELRFEAMSAFWPFFEKAMVDTSQARTYLKEFILTGPPEVRDFYVVRYGSIDQMYGQMINGAPGYYKYLQGQFNSDSLSLMKATIVGSMKRFKTVYPQAVFPKVYIVPGILNSGGTATEMGMFLGGDMYGRSAEMPTEELTDWQRGAIMNFSDLPRLTLHELMHFQQHYRDTVHSETLLSAVIHEGVCDFMVELCTGEVLQNENLKFLAEPDNQAWIFRELGNELMGNDTYNWLYNGGSIEDRPADLGYTVGYLICKSYYQGHQDKQEAVFQLLNTENFVDILQQSEYSYLLENASQSSLTP